MYEQILINDFFKYIIDIYYILYIMPVYLIYSLYYIVSSSLGRDDSLIKLPNAYL